MRILIDLQAKQNGSRDRGIGRYSLALTRAIARNALGHQICVLLNGLFPESVDEVRAALADVIPEQNTFVFAAHGPVDELLTENAWRLRAGEIIREQVINDLAPDFVLICSLFDGSCDNTISSVGSMRSDVPVAVILYDLIPFLDPDKYIGWPPARNWYFRKIDSLKRAQLLLSISQSAAREGIENLHIHERRVVNISSAVDLSFAKSTFSHEMEASFLQRMRINRKFLMHTSAFEPRKNFEGLIQAFAAIPKKLRTEVQLVLVCKLRDSERVALTDLAGTLGLGEDELILTGFIADADLISLYSLCHLFVFPSLHEGFGLPALEAMSCGAAVIGSNNSSIPEVIGLADALFAPASTASMGSVIQRALTDSNFYKSLKANALTQAKKFSWDSSARVAIAAMESVYREEKQADNTNQKKFDKLSSAVASIRNICCDALPSNLDLIGAARALYQNELSISRFKASAEFGGKLTWRIEGPFDSSYSLALLNRETARALEVLGHQVVLHSTEGPGDFAPNPAFLQNNPDLAEMNSRAAHFPAKLVDVISRNLYPPRVEDMDGPMNLLHHYAWEESGFPQEWVGHFNSHLQGITCLSKHVNKVMVDNGVRVPMVTSGCGVDHWERVSAAADYRLSAKSFRFLHVSSCFPRKGADALLNAFGQCFTQHDDVTLVVKTFPNPHNEIHRWLQQCRDKYTSFPDVVIIEDDLSDAELKALYQQCDVLVAPSRAEGYGLPMAEAMLSGMPVITTGWGGQLDFCNPQSSWLVDYTFVRAQSHFGLFASAWAEPDVEDLAKKLTLAYTSTTSQRRSMAAAGRHLLLTEFKWVDCVSRAVNAMRVWRDPSAEPPVPKIGWVSTWNTKCGIATTSEHLVENLPSEVTIFAPHQSNLVKPDKANCHRTWYCSKLMTLANGFDQVSASIRRKSLNTIVIQFNYGFYNFDELAAFIDTQIAEGRVVIVTLHSTTDPFELFNWQLSELRHSFSRCHRILVHSIPDLNRLKTLGLVDNVCLFPLGVLRATEPIQQPVSHSKSQLPIIGTYGFCLPHKGLKELIEAAAVLKKRGTPVRLRLVNAEFPDPVSVKLISELKALIASLNIRDLVELHNKFLEDDESLALLADATLLVFPYQLTGESASGAVRYGLASNKPVAVTPLSIFDDLGQSAFRFSGMTSADLANGIEEFLNDIHSDSPRAQEVRKTAERWRTSHDYAAVGTRLHNMMIALLIDRPIRSVVYSASGNEMKIGVGDVRGRAVITAGKAGFLLFGPYVSLTAGRYRVRITGYAQHLGTPVAYADIAIEGGTKVLASSPLALRRERGVVFQADIFLETVAAGFEVRVHVSSDTELVVNKLEILADGEFRADDRISPAHGDFRHSQLQYGERRSANASG